MFETKVWSKPVILSFVFIRHLAESLELPVKKGQLSLWYKWILLQHVMMRLELDSLTTIKTPEAKEDADCADL